MSLTTYNVMGTRTSGTGDLELVKLAGQTPYTGSNAVRYVIRTPLGEYEEGTGRVEASFLRGRTVSTSSNANALISVPMPPSGVTVYLDEQVDTPEGDGVGLVDANYGAITVSADGTVMSINDGAVGIDELGGDITASAKTFLAALTGSTRMAAIGLDTPENAQAALGFGTAVLQDADNFATSEHTHTPDEVGISMSTATTGQLVAVQSDGTLKPETPTLAAFASDGLAPVNGSSLYGEGGAWVTKTLQELLALANKDEIAVTFAIPEITTGDFPICPYVPAGAAGTITACYALTISGTQQIAVKIGGTTVTGLSALNVSSTRSSANATAANTIVTGSNITGTVNSGSSPVRGMGVLLVTTAI